MTVVITNINLTPGTATFGGHVLPENVQWTADVDTSADVFTAAVLVNTDNVAVWADVEASVLSDLSMLF